MKSLLLLGMAAFRLANPHAIAVDAIVHCGESAQTVAVAPQDVRDVQCGAEPRIASALPLHALEMREDDGAESQRLIAANAECPTVAMSVPLFGCERGTAAASLPAIGGATYAWTAQGANIVAGQGTPSIRLELADVASAVIEATIVTSECTRNAGGVIAIRKPLAIAELKTPDLIEVGKDVTVQWSYAAGAEPTSQILKGNALAAPVPLAKDQRSYTFKAQLAGTNGLELIASHAVSIAPSRSGRRRASAPTLITATNCADARAARTFEVFGCDRTIPRIDVPQSAEAGSTIEVFVLLQANETAQWLIQNGTLLSSKGGEARILVGDLAQQLDIRVRITRGLGCVVEPNASVVIRPRPSCTANPPAAQVSLVSSSCNSATVQATFTGTPPFRGTWSDGSTFETQQTTITKDFKTTGTYTIGSFRDAQCFGNVTGNASVKTFGPTVTLSARDNCYPTDVTATFTGVPPFIVRWMDGATFETNEMSITRSGGGSWGHPVQVFDSRCPNGPAGQATLQPLEPRSSVWPRDKVVCVYANAFEGGAASVEFGSRHAPFTVRWSDGLETTESVLSGGHGLVTRMVKTTEWSKILSIASARDGVCEANVDPKRADFLVTYRPYPYIQRDIRACAGTIATVRLDGKPLHPDAIIVWSATGAEILSGQGTSAITFMPVAGTVPRFFVKADYPDGACETDSQGTDSREVYVDPAPEIADFKAERPVIQPGESTIISFNKTSGVQGWGITVKPEFREKDLDLRAAQCTLSRCVIPYTDRSVYPGVTTLTLSGGGPCGTVPPQTITVTIAPP
jgi:hypothetical protein